MSIEIKRRSGTTAQHAAFVGKEAELTVDTDKHTVVVHDGVTPGGHPLAHATDVGTAIDEALGALTLDVSATGLPAGSVPTVDRTETETGIALAFGIPEGQRGEKGVQGDKGDTGNVMYATFDIDFDTGELVMTIPDGYTGPTFSINDETGELEVSI